MYKFILVLCVATILTACGNGDKKSNIVVLDENTTIEKPIKKTTTGLPDPGDLLKEKEIEKALNLHSGAVYDIKRGGSASSRTRSAFYRLDDPEKGNAAILLQISGNPIPDEFPDWDIDFIQSKKSDGEKTISNPDTAYMYKNFEVGEDGAYNLEQAKYYWRSQEGHVYMMAFNITKEKEEILKAAEELAKIAFSRVK